MPSAHSAPLPPFLIIDKYATLAPALAKQLLPEQLPVIVSRNKKNPAGTITIPYVGQIPSIPDAVYPLVLFHFTGEPGEEALVSPILKKAALDKARVILVCSIYIPLPGHVKTEITNYSRGSLFLYGDVVDSRLPFSELIDQFIHSAQRGSMVLPDNGLSGFYPIFFSDLITCLVKALSAPTQPKVAHLFPPVSLSYLSFARHLQKKYPESTVSFSHRLHEERQAYIPDGTPFVSEALFFAHLETTKGISSPQGKPLYHTHRGFRTKVQIPRRVLFLLCGIVLLWPVLFLGSVGGGVLSMYLGEQALVRGDLTQSATLASFSGKALQTGERMVSPFTGEQSPFHGLADTFSLGEQVVGLVASSAHAGLSLENVVAGKSLHPKEDFEKSAAVISQNIVVLNQLDAEDRIPTSVRRKLQTVQQPLQMLSTLLPILPDTLGFHGKKTYLVLFQNNMELRPGGGFIGSYGLVDVQNGQVGKLTVHDVYDADGQLKGHIDPPYPLRRYLRSPHWFLRDSNMEVSFSSNAAQAAKFLELETGAHVDGVVAIDVIFLQELLTYLGPITIPEYHEMVTADNVFHLTESHAEDNFFPGSSQKKDFLRFLATNLLARITEEKQTHVRPLLQAALVAIAQKHVLITVNDPQQSQVLAVSGLSSSLTDTRVSLPEAFPDFLSVNEANIGLNKANAFLTRSVRQEVVISPDGQLLTTLTMTYHNASTAMTKFGGDYRTYLQALFPSTTTLTGISLNGVTQTVVDAVTDPDRYLATGFVPPQGLEVAQQVTEGKRNYGFFFIVPAGQSKTVTLTATLGTIIPKGGKFTYDRWVVKQPGTDKDPYAFSLQYPATYQVLDKPASLTDVGGKLVEESVLDTDKRVIVVFSRK